MSQSQLFRFGALAFLLSGMLNIGLELLPDSLIGLEKALNYVGATADCWGCRRSTCGNASAAGCSAG